ncbi:MAG: polyribonucleotide nucleotidyltransferase [Waddliaceae bacterium]|nr:polyribonucleotide nucleotidyltransferase [Waddliaceae bacterium]MBT3579253.1 polyribonucleotide nucleotidyltransferase [Waddliaceae bacterium]MBT4444765.1 polyribonucleotide nucleotidyltransferase [Waddliaceae bacterium]MBT6929149.1 polyribonucleotide nucleotidyltransferase [Waddliaceae bacterium]MBT7264704.1 polyribonucleotide nucleotidyltransferase [Waddliaceae bacterium]
MKRKSISVTIGGKELTFETGKVAKQANGAVLVKVEDTVVFSSACASKEPSEGIDFLPLRVDYQEKFSSAGKSLGGFMKREGRPSQREILVSRLTDRPLRPLFPKGYHNEVQLLTYVWSYDTVNSTDVLGICAASAALTISDIPLLKPVGAVRVGLIDGEYLINPSIQQQKESSLDLVLAGTEEGILMIEGFCDFLTEEQVLEALDKGHESIKLICRALKEWREEVGVPKATATLRVLPEETLAAVRSSAGEEIVKASAITTKQERDEALSSLKERIIEELIPEGVESPAHNKADIGKAFKQLTAENMRSLILEKGVRPDGRGTKDVRFIDIETNYLPRTHGSCLFTRGETQAVAVCTLGGERMAQRFEDLDQDSHYKFYLQYFFPPFSVGEVGRAGFASRREIGHGKLAERALSAALPSDTDFPYVIRLESNITESNGSSSMASVCGSCLAMMNAGVPIKRPVSGIAMGLILEGEKFAVLSDILGAEDALGDMDFKITGDGEGITAFQMDIKIDGITYDIMKAALNQAKEGRVHILGKMLDACPAYNKELSSYAPRIEIIEIPPKKIGTVIGPGGKQIRAIVEETGVEMNIDDDGKVSISSSDAAMMERAKEIVKGLIAEAEIGKTYEGLVKSTVDFGAFVEILPGKEGLCHISELDTSRVDKVTDIVKEGDTISVKVLDVDNRSGKIKLSRKALLK